jgi:hypothetical protein
MMVERPEAHDRETSWGPPGEVGREPAEDVRCAEPHVQPHFQSL